MITFSIDTENGIPLYMQLYSYIKKEIQAGRILADSKLPSKRKLSEYLGISQNTIQSAYDQLIAEGYIVPVQRKGFYVCKLDNIINLNDVKNREICTNETEKNNVKYDFSYHGIDLETFPFSTWRKISKDVINEYDKDLIQLGDPQGIIELRESIAVYLHQSRGVNCSARQIIVSAGTEYLFQILIQLLDKDCIYGIENPGYEKLNLLFSSNSAKIKAINVDDYGMAPDEVEDSEANVICITPAHQFPFGVVMPINRRIQLLNWANEKLGRYIIEDDYDSEFKYSGKPIPAMQGLDANEKVIYMGAFSKSLSPALRISYMVLPKALLDRYLKRLSYLICPVPSIEQKVLTRFIEDGYFERHLNKMRNVYKKKREILVEEIQKLNSNIKVSGADAGLHLILNVKNGMAESELVKTALDAGVKVYGVSKYYIDKSYENKLPAIIIGFATMEEQEIREAVNILNKAWFK